MTPHDFRKIRALDQASVYAHQARAMAQEAYVRDPNIDRRNKLDEIMVALREYEAMAASALNEAYARLAANQPSSDPKE